MTEATRKIAANANFISSPPLLFMEERISLAFKYLVVHKQKSFYQILNMMVNVKFKKYNHNS